MSLITAKDIKKHNKKMHLKEIFFSFRKLKKMEKLIKKYYFSACEKTPNIYEIIIYANSFKKLSKEQIEYGLSLLVKKGKILNYSFLKYSNVDAYRITLSVVDSKPEVGYAIPDEIDLTDNSVQEKNTEETFEIIKEESTDNSDEETFENPFD